MWLMLFASIPFLLIGFAFFVQGLFRVGFGLSGTFESGRKRWTAFWEGVAQASIGLYALSFSLLMDLMHLSPRHPNVFGSKVISLKDGIRYVNAPLFYLLLGLTIFGAAVFIPVWAVGMLKKRGIVSDDDFERWMARFRRGKM